MIDTKQFMSAVRQIVEEKGISEQNVLETIEVAIAAAYKRDYGKKGQIIRAKLNTESGNLEIMQIHYVVEGFDEEGHITGQLPAKVTEERLDPQDYEGRRRDVGEPMSAINEAGELKIKFNPEKYIILSEAKEKQKNIEIGDELIERLEPHTDFGRIAAQTAKQVVIQRLREAERTAVFAEFKDREGQIISGVVQRREGTLVFIDLGKTNGLLIPAEQVPGENYRMGQRLRFVVLKVDETSRGPVIVLSRAHPKLVQELFRMEVPEIDSGVVEIKGIAREAGSRTKIAVSSKEESVDPIGSLVGQKGVRVQTVINELGGEKIDIILWDEKIQTYISSALSPAKILQVTTVDEERKSALAEVSDDQFSLAIGRRGQNVRLAAQLTGGKIDVRSPKEKMSSEEIEPASETELPASTEVPADAT
ncbi:MAG: transcription termination factor NusA [Patescibacteria group bacterium]